MKQRRRYSREYKVSAVQMTEKKNLTVGEVAESLGIGESMLRKWKKEYQDGKLMRFHKWSHERQGCRDSQAEA